MQKTFSFLKQQVFILTVTLLLAVSVQAVQLDQIKISAIETCHTGITNFRWSIRITNDSHETTLPGIVTLCLLDRSGKPTTELTSPARALAAGEQRVLTSSAQLPTDLFLPWYWGDNPQVLAKIEEDQCAASANLCFSKVEICNVETTSTALVQFEWEITVTNISGGDSPPAAVVILLLNDSGDPVVILSEIVPALNAGESTLIAKTATANEYIFLPWYRDERRRTVIEVRCSESPNQAQPTWVESQ